MSLILAIDDELHMLELLDAILSYEGHTLLRASDGKQALELLHEEVDLVITDLIMPNKEGLETIAEIRRRGFATPVIAMTGGGLIGPAEYLATARFVGANQTLLKPFSRSDVLAAVRALLPHEPLSSAMSG